MFVTNMWRGIINVFIFNIILFDLESSYLLCIIIVSILICFLSGAEDKHGYLWDRHYGICLAKFPHADVVNSVAFNPKDPEMLVTTSDDYTIKVWRSKGKVRQLSLNEAQFQHGVEVRKGQQKKCNRKKWQ